IGAFRSLASFLPPLPQCLRSSCACSITPFYRFRIRAPNAALRYNRVGRSQMPRKGKKSGNDSVSDLTVEILKGIRDELRGLRTEFKTEIAELRTEVSDLRTDTNTRFGALEKAILSSFEAIKALETATIHGFELVS